MVTVVCTKAFELDGRTIHCGEAVDLSAIDAAIRAYAGEVSLLERPSRPVYRTRDLQAAPVTQPVAIVVPSQAALVQPVKRRRGRPRKTKA